MPISGSLLARPPMLVVMVTAEPGGKSSLVIPGSSILWQVAFAFVFSDLYAG
jgi:hypothetical protein